MKVLLISLEPERFRWFMITHWVLCPDNWSEAELFIEKNIVIRQGKSGTSFPGVVLRVVRGSLDQLFSQIGYDKLIPVAVDQGSAKEIVQKSIGTHEKYAAIKWKTS